MCQNSYNSSSWATGRTMMAVWTWRSWGTWLACPACSTAMGGVELQQGQGCCVTGRGCDAHQLTLPCACCCRSQHTAPSVEAPLLLLLLHAYLVVQQGQGAQEDLQAATSRHSRGTRPSLRFHFSNGAPLALTHAAALLSLPLTDQCKAATGALLDTLATTAAWSVADCC